MCIPEYALCRYELSAIFTKLHHLDWRTTESIATNQFWCEKCMRYFLSSYNLQWHQRQTVNTCHFNDNKVTP